MKIFYWSKEVGTSKYPAVFFQFLSTSQGNQKNDGIDALIIEEEVVKKMSCLEIILDKPTQYSVNFYGS